MIVLFVVLAIAGAVVSYQLKQKRLRALAAMAASLGMRFSRHDPFGLLDLPFELLRRGDGRGVENVLWGTHGDHEVRVFEYWYYEQTTDPKGNTTRSYSRFSCAMLELPIVCPSVSISPESFFTRLADVVGLRDIDFESEEFNRAMQVKGDDPRFANYLIDARMMEWLLATRGWTFLVSGSHVMAVIHRLRPAEIPLIVEALAGFRQQMPRVVFDTYGQRP